jgi:hypothetical protein
MSGPKAAATSASTSSPAPASPSHTGRRRQPPATTFRRSAPNQQLKDHALTAKHHATGLDPPRVDTAVFEQVYALGFPTRMESSRSMGAKLNIYQTRLTSSTIDC